MALLIDTFLYYNTSPQVLHVYWWLVLHCSIGWHLSTLWYYILAWSPSLKHFCITTPAPRSYMSIDAWCYTVVLADTSPPCGITSQHGPPHWHISVLQHQPPGLTCLLMPGATLQYWLTPLHLVVLHLSMVPLIDTFLYYNTSPQVLHGYWWLVLHCSIGWHLSTLWYYILAWSPLIDTFLYYNTSPQVLHVYWWLVLHCSIGWHLSTLWYYILAWSPSLTHFSVNKMAINFTFKCVFLNVKHYIFYVNVIYVYSWGPNWQ